AASLFALSGVAGMRLLPQPGK
ncbi:MAG: hypothetical protein RL532_624, partial [Actinomycetota bacterium]